MVNALGLFGWKDVVQASDGSDAFEMVLQGGIDFVITDWNMHQVSGLELTKQIRASNYSNMPILMVTANNARYDVMAAIKAGVDNYIVKPIMPDVLKEKVDAILNK